MSQAELRPPQTNLQSYQPQGEREAAIWGAVRYLTTSMWQRLSRVRDIINGELTRGFPDDGNGVAITDNLDGGWATVTLTSANDLGTGSNSPITFTHGLAIPPVTNSNGDERCNVTWSVKRIIHGDVSGANAPPSATTNAAHVSVHFRQGDTVTADAIDLRIHSDITPSSTEPLVLSLWFEKAVQ